MGYPGNSMTLKDPKKYFSSLTAQKKTQQPLWIFSLFFFNICGCLSVSAATLLMQTECCLRLVLFFVFGMYNVMSLHWLLYSRNMFCCPQWPYSVLFYPMHKTVCVFISKFCFVADTTK